MTKDFSRAEFACKGENCCGGSAPATTELVAALQRLRDLIDRPIEITSGFRCNRHNAGIGGAPGSYHSLGMAADIFCRGMPPEELAEAAEQIDAFRCGGIGIYRAWVHVDTRDGRARWRA